MQEKVRPRLEKDQAFMINPRAIQWIVSQAMLEKADTVLEIGAGTGNLTVELAKSGARILAIENDVTLEKDLRARTRRYPNVEVVIGDALGLLDHRAISFDKVVSNIPFAISEPLVQRLVFHDFKLAVLTLPKSFARRLIAAPWERDYSRLSFVFQTFFFVRASLDLQRDTFRPMPRTHSIAMAFVCKPKNSLLCQMFLRPDMKTENALREALCSAKGYTKNQARITIKSLNLSNLLETKVSDLTVNDIRSIVRRAAEIS